MLQWLEQVFLPYLEAWEKSVRSREGFTAAQKQRMLLSSETRLGLKMTGILFIIRVVPRSSAAPLYFFWYGVKNVTKQRDSYD